MGKKHNKFKKHGVTKHNVVRPIQSNTEVRSSAVRGSEEPSGSRREFVVDDSNQVIQNSNSELRSPNFELPTDEMAALDEKYAFVRRDVRKLMIVLGSLVVLFVAIYFVNTKTTILSNLGDWIYRVGHFSI
ncbi:MAG TPA: hypothetical protein VJK08_00720 [Patescibacteria group bacterium]|nr:hypothetical protein [Patescibacteria group bacterium]